MDVMGSSRPPAACAEFPNDNPALHLGAIWRCAELGVLSCEVLTGGPPPPTAAQGSTNPVDAIGCRTGGDLGEADDATIEIVDDLDLGDAVEEGSLPAPEDVASTIAGRPDSSGDPFGRLVQVLGDAARSLGADNDALLCLRALFGFAPREAIAADDRATPALLDGQVLVRDENGLVRSSEFTNQVLAWQGILRGDSEDFGAHGPLEPLDEWAADVVARAVGNPRRADAIRRELRRRGVAAFGIVADAA